MSVNQDWRERYEKHIRSARWRNIRRDVLRLRGNTCERCMEPQAPSSLEVHHVTYERLGRERMSDLRVLCRDCHAMEDLKRAAAGRRRASEALAEARLAGWAWKVYGPHWEELDREYVEERFERWLERDSR
jgi:5-methylcytosine-specific restriction endonuclease McrA